MSNSILGREDCFLSTRQKGCQNLAFATVDERVSATFPLIRERIAGRNRRTDFKQTVDSDDRRIAISEDGVELCSAEFSEALDREIARYRHDIWHQRMIVELKQFEDQTERTWSVPHRLIEPALRIAVRWLTWGALDRSARKRRKEPTFVPTIELCDTSLSRKTLDRLRDAAERHCQS